MIMLMKTEIDTFRAKLENAAGGMGGVVFGVADLEGIGRDIPGLLDGVHGDYSRAVVVGVRLQTAVLEGIVDRPTPLYFHNYRQANYQLDRIGFAVAGMIQEAGNRALAVPASQIIQRDPMCGHVSHKLLGHAAGLGFHGRNNLLVNPRYGAQVRYVSVLTDMPLEPDKAVRGDCGKCRACIEQCPASAIREKVEDFDLSACYGKLCEFTRLPYIGQHICGVCVKACPGGNGNG